MAISGMVMRWLSVISITMTDAVIGACTDAGEIAHHAEQHDGAGRGGGDQQRQPGPRPAPIASEGAKMPPGMPLT